MRTIPECKNDLSPIRIPGSPRGLVVIFPVYRGWFQGTFTRWRYLSEWRTIMAAKTIMLRLLVNTRAPPRWFPGQPSGRPFCCHDLPQFSPTTMDEWSSPLLNSPLYVLSGILPPSTTYLVPTTRQLPAWYQTRACSRRRLGTGRLRSTNHHGSDDA